MSKDDSIGTIGSVGKGENCKHADIYKQIQANREKFAAGNLGKKQDAATEQ